MPTIRNSEEAEFASRARRNQSKLRAGVRGHYDFIICGSGSSGSVIARRLAENPEVQVLLLEAGGCDDVPEVRDAIRWPANYASERNWSFLGERSSYLNGRRMPLAMGKVLGGGSSVNAMQWARGHKNDWDFFASEAGDDAWNYQSVLNIYRRVEDWHGDPDPDYRGVSGPVFVQPAPDPNPIAPAMVEAARSVGIPTFSSHNGRMMETEGGASLTELCARGGQRLSVFRSYTYPFLDRPNLTVLTRALVTRVIFDNKRAVGVEIVFDDRAHRITAGSEVVLSLGAINTPKVLMRSGIGDEVDLRRWSIPVVAHLPGVGQNFQDHVLASCIWEYEIVLPPHNNAGEATFFWKSEAALDTPDLQACQAEVPICSAESAARFNSPPAGWTLLAGVVRPKSRGRIRLTGPDPLSPVQIEDNLLSHPDDMKAATAALQLSREIGNSAPLRPYTKREVMPGSLQGVDLENFIREVATTFSHETCTAKMRDSMSVVDGHLNVYGIEGLRVADGSIMPRVTTGNTMAPCVVIGERAAEMMKVEHKL
jgi:choline dehydrogenase